MGSLRSSLTVDFVTSLSHLEPETWNRLAGENDPFLEWEWLASLEEANCSVPSTGWHPRYVLVHAPEGIVGACPVYIKDHSRGEFVYDFSWAEAAAHVGIRYYPKLLVGVPFTPVTGPRLLVARGYEAVVLPLLAETLVELCERGQCSSVHVNFCTASEAELLRCHGFLVREGYQFHWNNRGWSSFEEFLGALRAKRRNQILRERRALRESGIEMRVVVGEDVTPALMDSMYRLYLTTVDKYFWGQRYLSPELFRLLAARWRQRLCLSLAYRGRRLVAGALAVRGKSVLFGRYWGAFEEHRFLHFEVCYYRLLEFCLAEGVERFEPGAGGEFKELRGFAPARTYSAHYLRDPRLRRAIARFVEQERWAIEKELQWWAEHSSYRRGFDDGAKE
jgi:predicted N-acyltransferase